MSTEFIVKCVNTAEGENIKDACVKAGCDSASQRLTVERAPQLKSSDIEYIFSNLVNLTSITFKEGCIFTHDAFTVQSKAPWSLTAVNIMRELNRLDGLAFANSSIVTFTVQFV